MITKALFLLFSTLVLVHSSSENFDQRSDSSDASRDCLRNRSTNNATRLPGVFPNIFPDEIPGASLHMSNISQSGQGETVDPSSSRSLFHSNSSSEIPFPDSGNPGQQNVIGPVDSGNPGQQNVIGLASSEISEPRNVIGLASSEISEPQNVIGLDPASFTDPNTVPSATRFPGSLPGLVPALFPGSLPGLVPGPFPNILPGQISVQNFHEASRILPGLSPRHENTGSEHEETPGITTSAPQSTSDTHVDAPPPAVSAEIVSDSLPSGSESANVNQPGYKTADFVVVPIVLIVLAILAAVAVFSLRKKKEDLN